MDVNLVWSASPFDACEADLPTPSVAGRLIYIRLEKDGFRPIDLYLFTTLTDREAYPADDIVALYGQRWNVELDFRHVKIMLDMEALEGKSLDIVRKELLLGLLAYNLLRGLMAIAAIQAHRSPLELSLAQCWRRTTDACRSLPPGASQAEVERVLAGLLVRLGNCVLPKRKRERFEPRAVWGRPRVYPTIKGSREEARQAALDSMKPNS
jgi:putative transposase